MWQRFGRAQGSFRRNFKGVLTSFRDTGGVLTSPVHDRRFGRRGSGRALTLALPRPGWKSAGILALLCSGVAWASLPRVGAAPTEDQRQWQALGIAPRRVDRNADGGDRGGPARGVRAASRCRGGAGCGGCTEACRNCNGPASHPRPRRRRALLVAPRRRRFAAGGGAISGGAGDRDRRRRRRAQLQLRHGARARREPALRRPPAVPASASFSSFKWNANGRSEWIDAAERGAAAAGLDRNDPGR